jgi:hypothetical protein
MRDFLESRRDVVAHVDRLFPKSTTELSYILNGGMIQCPQRVFVKGFDPLSQTNLDAVRKQVILA